MKKSRILVCIAFVLAITLLFMQVPFASANMGKIESQNEPMPSIDEILLAIEPLINAQKQHYDINKISVLNLTAPQASGDNYVFKCDVVLRMTLKYSTMEELPHIVGL